MLTTGSLEFAPDRGMTERLPEVRALVGIVQRSPRPV